jgi:hypothetical protein
MVRVNQNGIQGKYWVFTLNNYSELDIEFLISLYGPRPRKIQRLVFQKEIGENQTPHLQGYLELWNNMRFRPLKRLLGDRYHIERRAGTRDQAKAYAMKEDTRAPNTEPYIYGDWPIVEDKLKNLVIDLKMNVPLNELEDRYPTQFLLHRNNIETEYVENKGTRNLTPNKENCYIFVGPSGSGKSTTANEMFPEAYHGSWPTGGRWWWGGYKGQEVAIFDEFRQNISYQQMLNLLDVHPMRIEKKGSQLQMVSKKIVITSIRDPKEWYSGVEDKSELERRINENCTIFDFEPGHEYPNFVKHERTERFKFNEYQNDWNGGHTQRQRNVNVNDQWGRN